MPAQQLLVQQLQLLGNNGLPLAAGRAFFYVTGTTTLLSPVNLQDVDGDPYANPVIADSAGYIPQPYYNGITQVKVVVTTALGTTVSTIDPVSVSASGPTIASGILFTAVSGITSTNVQSALAEIAPINEDSMATGSNSRPPTQDSVVAYIAARAPLNEDNMVSASNTRAPTQDSVVNYIAGGLTDLGTMVYGTTDGNPSTTIGAFGIAVKESGLVSAHALATVLDLNRPTDGAIVFFRRNTTSVGSISVDATTTTYATSSGRGRKKNIMPAGNAGDIIDAIQPVSFQWRENDATVSHGFIAQDLAEVFPEAVVFGENDDDPAWGVDPSKMVALMMTELKSLRARVAMLEAAQ